LDEPLKPYFITMIIGPFPPLLTADQICLFEDFEMERKVGLRNLNMQAQITYIELAIL